MKTTKQAAIEGRFASRRKEVLKRIKGEVAIFPAAPELTCSRDQLYPYRQNSDFLYLTGLTEPNSILVLLGSSKGPRSVLYLRERDLLREKWLGETVGLKRAKKRFQVDEVRDIKTFASNLASLVSNTAVLHYPPGINEETDSLVFSLFQSPLGLRPNYPHALKDARLLTTEMRSVKDKLEIAHLKHAANITVQSFLDFLPELANMRSEKHAAQVLEAHFSRLGAEGPGYATIVASGKNATYLHHEPNFQPLWKRELVLIDAGAVFNGYSADLTRTFPVSGTFSSAQADVYDIVYKALESALSLAKPGSSLAAMHEAAVRSITEGLIELKVIKGQLHQLVQSEAYKPFFMHRIGHWLGLDVHDVAPLYADGSYLTPFDRPFVPGNVITVEPGLYFDSRDKTLPRELRGIGIRIEDNVLITGNGHEVLTSRMPRSREEIENLLKFFSRS